MQPDQVRAQLERVLQSAQFVRSGRLAPFLRFIVQAALSDDAEGLRERTLGTAIFDRDPDWDPKLDNIVRSEARRLRDRLDEYYKTSGAEDDLQISVPKGGYLAVFHRKSTEQETLPEQAGPESISSLSPSAILPPPISTQSGGQFHPLFVTVTVLLGVALLFFAWRYRPVEAKEAVYGISPVAAEIGLEFSPAVSPDGKQIAYVWDGNGKKYDVYLKQLADGRVTRVTDNTGQNLSPSWSPDGLELAFFRMGPAKTLLVVRNLQNGTEKTVTEIRSSLNVWFSDTNPYSNGLGPSWSPDGKSLLFSEAHDNAALFPQLGHGLVAISLETGKRQQLTFAPSTDQDYYPRFSPDGSSIAFTRFKSHGVADVYLLPAAGGKEQRLTFKHHAIRGLNWTADGRGLIFSADHRGSFQLNVINRNGGEVKNIPADTASAAEPSPFPNGNQLAYVEVSENWNIWRAPLTAHGIGKPVLFLSSTGRTHSPSISLDNRSVAFVSDRSGAPEVWVIDSDGQNMRQLTHFGGPWLGGISWSPNGQDITFDARPRGHSGIFTLSLHGGEPKALAENSFEERRPFWSRDGRSIYFNSNRSGTLQIRKISLADHHVQIVSGPGSFGSNETTNGKTLLYDTEDHQLFSKSPDSNPSDSVPLGIHSDPALDWSPAPDGIYFAGERDGCYGIFFYSFADQRIKLAGKSERPLSTGTPSLNVSSDGCWILYSQIDHMTSDIKMRRGAIDVPH